MAETLQEYLLKLGFTVDKGQEARFNASLSSLAKTMAGIGATLAAAATTIAGTVTAVAASFDQLYFAAQRTNASVAGIKSLSYALSQVGGSSEQALAAMEGVAAAMRTNPGVEARLNKIGVITKENGRLRETGAVIDDIVKTLGTQPYYVSAQIAADLGIPDERSWATFTAQWPKIREFQREYEKNAKAAGLDPAKAAESSNRLMTSFRRLMLTVDILMQKVTIELQPVLSKYLEAFSKWVSDHQTDIVAVIEAIVKAVGNLASGFATLVGAMAPVVDTFASMAKSLGAQDGGLEWALTGVLAFMAASWMPKMLGFIARIGGAWGLVALAMGLISTTSSISSGTAKDIVHEPFGTTGPNGMAGDWIDPSGKLHKVAPNPVQAPSMWQRFKRAIGLESAHTPAVDASGMAVPSNLAKITSKSGQTAWVAKDAAPQFQGFIDDLEATGYRIKDLGGFSSRVIAGTNTPSHHAGGHAIDINPKENDLGTGTGDLPPNTGDLAKKWGLGWGALWRSKNDPMHFSTGENEGGRVMSPEEIERVKGLRDKSSSLMSPAPLGGSVNRSATLSQKTDIVIYGSTDPAGTSALLGGSQNRIASDLLRNAQSAFA